MGGRPLLWEVICVSSWKAEQDGVKEAGVNFPGTLSAMSYLCARVRVCVCVCVSMCVCVCARARTSTHARPQCVHPKWSWGPAGYSESISNSHTSLTLRTIWVFCVLTGDCFKIAKGIVEPIRTLCVFRTGPFQRKCMQQTLGVWGPDVCNFSCV